MKTPKQVYDAFRKSMLDKSDDWKTMIAEEVHLKGPLAEISGKAGFIEINMPFFAGIQDSRLLNLVENGDYIITQIETDVGTPSGDTLTLEVCEWYEIREGLIQSLRVYFDADALRKMMMPG